MTASWRDILEGATASFSIDPNRARSGQVQHRHSIQGPRRRSPMRSYSSAEARDLLERELEAISARPIDDLPASVDRRQAVNQRPRSKDDRPAFVDSWRPITERARSAGDRLASVESGQAVNQRPRSIDDRPDTVDGRQVINQRVRFIDGPASTESTQAAKQRKGPRSLMAALNAVSPGTPAVPENSTPPIMRPKRLPWRSFLLIPLSAAIIFLAAHTVLNHGGRDAGTSVTREAAPATSLDGALVSVPLPSRRPSNLRGEQSRDRGSSR